jgi:hypothetical protein
VADTTDGIEAMRERMTRASRKPPPARRGSPSPTPDAGTDGRREPTPAPEATPPAPARPRSTVPRPPRARAVATGMRLAPDLPPVNLAIRVRRPLDDRLADLIHTLRQRGVRTSKVELIEMLLWELPDPLGGADEVLERLGRFRVSASRAVGGAIPGETTSP